MFTLKLHTQQVKIYVHTNSYKTGRYMCETKVYNLYKSTIFTVINIINIRMLVYSTCMRELTV